MNNETTLQQLKDIRDTVDFLIEYYYVAQPNEYVQHFSTEINDIFHRFEKLSDEQDNSY